MAKIVLNDIGSGFNRSIINGNFDLIEDDLQDRVLYRDNPTGEPNQMENDLDMNSNRVLNLPSPLSSSEPVTLGYLSQLDVDINNLGTVTAYSLTAVGGEQTINLPFTYSLGGNSVHVFLNGIKLLPGVDFTEIDNDTVNITDPLLAGDVLEVLGLGVVLSVSSETGLNLGTGEGVFESKVGNALRFKSLVAGNNISLSSDGNEISIDASATGETNTASNVGLGSGVFKDKNGLDLRFKSLVAGTNITLTPGTDEITIDAAAAAGETNTLGSAGGTVSLAAAKVGTQLNTKGLTAGNGISLSSDANSVTIGSTIWTVSGSDVYRSSGSALVGTNADISYTLFNGTVPLTSSASIQAKEGAFFTRTAGASDSFVNAMTVVRDTDAVSGGTPGFVNAGSLFYTRVGAAQTSFEWNALFLLDNKCNAGDSVAAYAQARSYGAGPTFAGVFECRALPGSTGSLIGLEIDCYPDTTTPNPSSVGIDIVTGNSDGSANAVSITAGIRLSTGVNPTTAKFQTGIDITQCSNVGLNITGTSTTNAINIQGTNTLGINLSGGTFSGAAIRLGSGHKISFEVTDTVNLSWKTYSGFGTALTYNHGGSDRFGIDASGNTNQTGSMYIGGTKVVGTRASWPGVWSNIDVASWTTANVDMSTITDALLNSVDQATATRPLWNYVSNIIKVLKDHGLMG